MLITFRGQSVKEFLFATLQLLIDHLVCRPVFCITVVTSNFSGDLRLNTQFKSVDNMNYEPLILKNNSLNKIVVVLWFIFYVRLCANLQAVRRDQQSVDEQICGGGGWAGFDAILQNRISPYFTISEVGINTLSVHVVL